MEPSCFRPSHPGTTVVGADISKKGFDKNTAKFVALVVCDGAHLPFADRAFEWEYCAHVLEHVSAEKRLSFISEMGRTTRIGMFFAVPNAQRILSHFNSTEKVQLVEAIKRNVRDWFHRLKGDFEQYHRGFTKREMATMLSACFSNVKCVSAEYDAYMTRNSPYGLVIKIANRMRLLDIVTPAHTFICIR